VFSFLDDGSKYLILVPKRILTEQLSDEILEHFPNFDNKIQIIGDGNNIFNDRKDITICVYNSVNLVMPYIKTFNKIYIDEAHHVYTPEHKKYIKPFGFIYFLCNVIRKLSKTIQFLIVYYPRNI
jgi:superfamily II DNA or RNA helicase